MKRSASLSYRSVSHAFILILVIAFATALAIWSPPVSAQGPAVSDISVLKSGDETAVPGGQIQYQVVVTNEGPDVANNVRLSDPLPTHTTYVNATVTQGSFSLNGGTVDANFGTINPGESAALNLTVSVDSNTEPGTTITNTAIARSDSSDSNLANNQGSASTQIVSPAANLSVVKLGPDT